MTNVTSTVAVDADPATNDSPRLHDEIRTFIAAISTVLHETVAAFEKTVTHITEITVSRPGRADRDLVVALQAFDRLQQEFATLGEVLARLSIKPDETVGEGAVQEVIAGVSIADLKNRLLHHHRILTADTPEPDAQEVVF